MKKTFIKMLIYFLCFISLVVNIKNVLADNIQDGDLVKAEGSSAVYLIQNGERKVFPHSSVYLSWGYPADFSTVKTITKDELLSYTLGGAIIYRDGFVFRFKGASMPGGFDSSAVFFVSDGKVRPIDSVSTYMELFNGGVNDSSAWDKIYWIPKDLLEDFTYPKGDDITSNQLENGELPNGLIIQNSDGSTSVVKDGKLSEITQEALSENRYTTNEKIFKSNLLSNVDSNILSKAQKGTTISTKDSSLLNIRSIDITMLPIEEDNTNANTNTNTGSGSGSSSSGSSSTDTTSVVNTTPLTPTSIIPVSKVSEDPFSLTSVSMASDSDRVINIYFNKNVQKSSSQSRFNYTFRKLDGTSLNSTTGGSRIDLWGHPVVTPVRDYSDNKHVTITLGSQYDYTSGIPSGTYQLCISNIKVATGTDVISTTCKQFNVSNTIRPTLYWNSNSFELNANYLISSNKILIKYSEPMGDSAKSGFSYKIRDFTSDGHTITSWTSLAYIYGTTLTFLNNNRDVLITFPNYVTLINSDSNIKPDFTIGDSSIMSYVPKDIGNNLFEETTNGTTSLTINDITISTTGISINNDIDSIEVLSPTQIAVFFSREISYVDASEFKFKDLSNQLGFSPVSATISSDDSKEVIFTVSSGNAFSISDKYYDVGISIDSDNNLVTQNTKDIIGLPIYFDNSSGDWVASISFVNKIKASLSSFVIADPNTIYLKLNGGVLEDEDSGYYYNLSKDLIIQNGNTNITGYETMLNLDESIDGPMTIVGGGSDMSMVRPNNIVKILLSKSLNTNEQTVIKTVDDDSISSFGENRYNISSNTNGITNSVFAAYSVNRGFFASGYSRQTAVDATNNLTLKYISTISDDAYLSKSTQNNIFTFSVSDNNLIPCYTNDFNKDTDYFTQNYYDAVKSVAKNISGKYHVTLSCNIDDVSHPLYLGLLKDALESYYSSANKIIEMDYPYHYNDNTVIQPFSVTSSSNGLLNLASYYTISYGADNFLSIRFNKNVDLNTLSNGGWTTLDNISYGKTINNSIIFSDTNNEITFSGINLGEFKIEGNTASIQKMGDTIVPPLDAYYSYNTNTHILTINITDSAENQSDVSNTTVIYTLIMNQSYMNDPYNWDNFIRYIPNSSIKDTSGDFIDSNITPYANLKEF